MGCRLSRTGAVLRTDAAADRLRRCDPRIRQDRHRLLVHARYRRDSDRTRSGTERQSEIVARIRRDARTNTASSARWSPPRRSITRCGRPVPRPKRPKSANTPHSASGTPSTSATSWARKYAVYWPGSLGYFTQGAIDETQTLRWYADALNAACEHDIEVAKTEGPADTEALPGSQAVRAAGRNPAADQRRDARIHRFGTADASGDGRAESGVSARTDVGRRAAAALARALLAGKLWHFDINDGYRLKHDVDIAVGLVNPLDWLNVLMLLRRHGYNGPFNLDYKPPRTTSNHGVFAVSFPTAVDRFITLWEMAGEALEDPIIGSHRSPEGGPGVSAGTRCRSDRRSEQGAADAARTDRASAGPDPARTASRPDAFFIIESQTVK